ncbi:hypothetical protein K7432_012285 [Basidiobolus ranarum]|uniref:Uncharacterized protein n=1 Tax=Basidiobolus ranarum TaxID=34480 RepID=A0ABR2VSI6_9FUNG
MRFPNPREVRSLLYQKDISAKRSSKDQELLEVCVRILSKLDGPISNTSLGYKLRENPEWKKLVPSSGLTKFLRNEDRKKYFSVTDELKDGGWVTWVQYTGCPLPKGIEQTFQELALVDSEAPLTVSENKLVEEMQELVKRLECSSEEKEKWEALRVLVERLTRKKRPKYKIDAYLFG